MNKNKSENKKNLVLEALETQSKVSPSNIESISNEENDSLESIDCNKEIIDESLGFSKKNLTHSNILNEDVGNKTSGEKHSFFNTTKEESSLPNNKEKDCKDDSKKEPNVDITKKNLYFAGKNINYIGFDNHGKGRQKTDDDINKLNNDKNNDNSAGHNNNNNNSINNTTSNNEIASSDKLIKLSNTKNNDKNNTKANYSSTSNLTSSRPSLFSQNTQANTTVTSTFDNKKYINNKINININKNNNCIKSNMNNSSIVLSENTISKTTDNLKRTNKDNELCNNINSNIKTNKTKYNSNVSNIDAYKSSFYIQNNNYNTYSNQEKSISNTNTYNSNSCKMKFSTNRSIGQVKNTMLFDELRKTNNASNNNNNTINNSNINIINLNQSLRSSVYVNSNITCNNITNNNINNTNTNMNDTLNSNMRATNKFPSSFNNTNYFTNNSNKNPSPNANKSIFIIEPESENNNKNYYQGVVKRQSSGFVLNKKSISYDYNNSIVSSKSSISSFDSVLSNYNIYNNNNNLPSKILSSFRESTVSSRKKKDTSNNNNNDFNTITDIDSNQTSKKDINETISYNNTNKSINPKNILFIEEKETNDLDTSELKKYYYNINDNNENDENLKLINFLSKNSSKSNTNASIKINNNIILEEYSKENTPISQRCEDKKIIDLNRNNFGLLNYQYPAKHVAFNEEKDEKDLKFNINVSENSNSYFAKKKKYTSPLFKSNIILKAAIKRRSSSHIKQINQINKYKNYNNNYDSCDNEQYISNAFFANSSNYNIASNPETNPCSPETYRNKTATSNYNRNTDALIKMFRVHDNNNNNNYTNDSVESNNISNYIKTINTINANNANITNNTLLDITSLNNNNNDNENDFCEIRKAYLETFNTLLKGKYSFVSNYYSIDTESHINPELQDEVDFDIIKSYYRIHSFDITQDYNIICDLYLYYNLRILASLKKYFDSSKYENTIKSISDKALSLSKKSYLESIININTVQNSNRDSETVEENLEYNCINNKVLQRLIRKRLKEAMKSYKINSNLTNPSNLSASTCLCKKSFSSYNKQNVESSNTVSTMNTTISSNKIANKLSSKCGISYKYSSSNTKNLICCDDDIANSVIKEVEEGNNLSNSLIRSVNNSNKSINKNSELSNSEERLQQPKKSSFSQTNNIHINVENTYVHEEDNDSKKCIKEDDNDIVELKNIDDNDDNNNNNDEENNNDKQDIEFVDAISNKKSKKSLYSNSSEISIESKSGPTTSKAIQINDNYEINVNNNNNNNINEEVIKKASNPNLLNPLQTNQLSSLKVKSSMKSFSSVLSKSSIISKKINNNVLYHSKLPEYMSLINTKDMSQFPTLNKDTLVFDLDETLIHSESPINLTKKYDVTLEDHNIGVFIRPELHKFLYNVSFEFNLALFSAGTRDYVDAVLEALHIKNFFFLIFTQECCVKINKDIYVKDLDLVDSMITVFFDIYNKETKEKIQENVSKSMNSNSILLSAKSNCNICNNSEKELNLLNKQRRLSINTQETGQNKVTTNTQLSFTSNKDIVNDAIALKTKELFTLIQENKPSYKEKETILIDNSIFSFAKNPDKGIHVDNYYFNKSDDVLINELPEILNFILSGKYDKNNEIYSKIKTKIDFKYIINDLFDLMTEYCEGLKDIDSLHEGGDNAFDFKRFKQIKKVKNKDFFIELSDPDEKDQEDEEMTMNKETAYNEENEEYNNIPNREIKENYGGGDCFEKEDQEEIEDYVKMIEKSTKEINVNLYKENIDIVNNNVNCKNNYDNDISNYDSDDEVVDNANFPNNANIVNIANNDDKEKFVDNNQDRNYDSDDSNVNN